MSFQKGDSVIIECEGRTIEGQVLMISDNQNSMLLEFDAILAGHVGQMPVMRFPDGSYRSIISKVEVKVSPATD